MSDGVEFSPSCARHLHSQRLAVTTAPESSQNLSRLKLPEVEFLWSGRGHAEDKGQRRAAAQCVVLEELVCVPSTCFMKSSGDEARSDHTFNHTPVSPRSSESTAETRCRVVRREQTPTAAESSRHHVSPELTDFMCGDGR